MRSCPEAVCGGVGRDKSVLQTGTTRSREVSARIGVTSDEAENAPRLRVANGEDSPESKPPVKRRVETHTASIQDSSTPVPWRWGSRTGNRRLQRTRPFPRGYLDRGTPGSLLMAFPETGNKGVTRNLPPGRLLSCAPCPEAVCGGVGRDKSGLQTGTTRARDGVPGSGSPMMRPKTLPDSKSSTGKTPKSLSHQSAARV